MPLLSALVDLGDLLSSIVAALLSAILFTFAVSASIRGAARYVDYGSEGRGTAAVISLAFGIFFGVLAVGLVVAGLYLLISG